MIAAIILIVLVVGVVGIASTFFTGFTKEKSASVGSKSSAMIDCSVATLEIDKNIVGLGPTVSVAVENTGWTDLSNIKLVVYNSTGAYELDPSPDSLSINEIRVLEASYPGEPILNKLSVTTRDCPGVDDTLGFTFSYQEDADEIMATNNVSTNVTDGDWDTSETFLLSENGPGDFEFNYTKSNSFFGAIWQVKDGEGKRNLTVPSDCYNVYNNKIRLRFYADDDEGVVRYYCYNGSSWGMDTGKLIYESGLLGTVYEEAVWWNVISD